MIRSLAGVRRDRVMTVTILSLEAARADTAMAPADRLAPAGLGIGIDGANMLTGAYKFERGAEAFS
jgi:hypothetical protein